MLIIGIAGGTGSGKTTVVRKIIESLPAGEVVLLPQDSYYKDSSHVPVEERQNINFDHPDAFEWSLLSRHVAMLREGKSIEQPTYSYLTCTRQPETIHIAPREVIIIEGILALCDKKLRSMMDLKIFVDADPDERLIRVIQRDVVNADARQKRYGTLYTHTKTHAPAIHRALQTICRPHCTGRRKQPGSHRYIDHVYQEALGKLICNGELIMED